MKIKYYFIIVLLTLLSTTQAQKRYQEELFNRIDSFKNLSYGKAINIKGEEENLLLDVFVPPVADKIRYRPLVIFIHGGGFVNNTKSSVLSNTICTTLSKKGYVTATIDYRLGVANPKNNIQYFEAMYRAQQDAKAAVRYFKKNAEDYGIDKTQIFVVGASAGAMTALALAYMDEKEIPEGVDIAKWGSLDGNSGNLGFSSSIAGVINLWGALPKYSWIKKGDIPLLNIGGTADKIVPYDSAFDFHGFKYGPKSLHDYCTSVQVNSTLKTFNGAGHGLDYLPKRYDSCVEFMSDWLYTKLTINNPAKQTNLFSNLNEVCVPSTILKTMEKVANWQLNLWDTTGYKYHTWHWANAAGYTGLFELSKISKNKVYEKRLLQIGTDLDWNTGPSRFFADDYCIAQTYANLYIKYKKPAMLSRFKLIADTILARPHTESLDWKDSINYREWAWCDALFMGPPALAYFSTAT